MRPIWEGVQLGAVGGAVPVKTVKRMHSIVDQAT